MEWRTISQTNLLVKTISRLDDMQKFISIVRLNPDGNRKEIFLDVFKFEEEELEMMLFFGMFNLNNNICLLEKQLNKMRMLGFENFIKEELVLLQKQYPSNRIIQFELFILDEEDDFVKSKLGGVSAFTNWDGKMCFTVLPEENVRKMLKSVITHEYHHHWRISALEINEANQTLLDRMILEGLAEHFIRLKLGEKYLGPFKDALSEIQAKNLWESHYIQHINDKGTSTDVFMFGNEEEGIPFWGGYALGYYLVKWYLDNNKDISIEELTVSPSYLFIE